MVTLDVRGQPLTLSRKEAEGIRAAAAAAAGSSSRRRDLALVMDWALASPRVVVLRRGEARELQRLLTENDLLRAVADRLDGQRSRAA